MYKLRKNRGVYVCLYKYGTDNIDLGVEWIWGKCAEEGEAANRKATSIPDVGVFYLHLLTYYIALASAK